MQTTLADPTPGAAVMAAGKTTIERIAANRIMTLASYAGFVFAKVLAACDWRVSTALAVLDASSLPAVVAGATLSALPPLSLVLLSIIGYCWMAGHWDGKWAAPAGALTKRSGRAARFALIARRNRVFLGWTLLLAAIVFAIESWTLTVVVLGVAIVVAGLARASRIDHPFTVVFGVLVTVLVYAQVVSSVWLPHEAVVYGHRPATTKVGYVIDSGSDDLVLLESGTRLLLRIPSGSVRDRYQCLADAEGFGGLLPVSHYSFLLLLVHEPVPPACPHG